MTLYITLIFTCILWTFMKETEHDSALTHRYILQNKCSVLRHIILAVELIGPAKTSVHIAIPVLH